MHEDEVLIKEIGFDNQPTTARREELHAAKAKLQFLLNCEETY